MAENSANQNGNPLSSIIDAARSAVKQNPAVEHLFQELEEYLAAQARRLVSKNGKAPNIPGKVKPESVTSPLKGAAKKAKQGAEKAKPSGQGGGGDQNPPSIKSVNIVEDIDIGVQVRVAYDQWTKFTEFGKWSKATETIDQEDEIKTKWRAKIAFSTRNWNATIIEQVPDKRIIWKSEGPKGVVNGIVTFHPLGDELTKVLISLEYLPAGFFEKTANLWRAQGRRARLDLKMFRRFVMMQQQVEDGWRGEIHDSEVTSNEETNGDNEH